MRTDYDIVIVGSGFGGSLLAMVARRLGKTVLLVERGRHPRFAIGESTSPLANLLLEQIALRYDLPRLLPLTTYGSWQRAYPEIGCGLKRGFTYFHHEAGRSYRAAPGRSNQLLVAASPNDATADTHWLRSDVDHFLVREATGIGVDYVDETFVSDVEWSDGTALLRLQSERNGEPVRIRANLIVDATGPRGFLSKVLGITESPFANYPATQTLFSHFTGVSRCEDMESFRPIETPPYPLDDAAVHHVFDGGWMWLLRFGNGVTSAGIALKKGLAEELRLSEGEPAWGRFLSRFPTIRDQFAAARPTRPFTYSARLAYRSSRAAGPGWALLPSAAAFVDPFFSTGIPLTLLGIQRMGRILEETSLGTGSSSELQTRLDAYGEATLAEADWAAHLIGACYAAFPDFRLFSSLAMFYFAAASFSEIAHRVEKPWLADRYLGAGHPTFAEGLRHCARILGEGIYGRGTPGKDAVTVAFETRAFAGRVAEAISLLNIAGLCDASKRNWYGVDLADVVRGADKLGMEPSRMREIIECAPWAGNAPVALR